MLKKLSVVVLATTILSFGSTAFAKGDAKAGKKVYDQNCTSCHGAKGKGDGAAAAALNPKPNNFSLGKFKYGSGDADLAKTIKNGKGPMPPWGAVLSGKDVDNVIAYIRSLKK
ncbi:MAG: cytochrome c [Candidatus Sericytochromatia bacterium]